MKPGDSDDGEGGGNAAFMLDMADDVSNFSFFLSFLAPTGSAIPCRLLTYHIMFIMIVIITNRGVVVNTCKEFDTLPLSKGNRAVRATLPRR